MWCGCTSVIILSCVQPHPRLAHAKASPNRQGSITIFATWSDCGGTWRTSSLSLNRARRRRRHRGPALVKTRSRELVRVNVKAFRHRRAGGDDNAVCRRRMRFHVGGGCGNSEQSDSHEPGNCSMPRHADLLLWSKRPLVLGHGNFAKVQQQCDKYGLRESADGQRSCPKFKSPLRLCSGRVPIN
jgi:hypothetical protein